ncbi:MAG: hypothetical protein WDO68_20020 [Gammaproteobacteria bacterium]
MKNPDSPRADAQRNGHDARHEQASLLRPPPEQLFDDRGVERFPLVDGPLDEVQRRQPRPQRRKSDHRHGGKGKQQDDDQRYDLRRRSHVGLFRNPGVQMMDAAGTRFGFTP